MKLNFLKSISIGLPIVIGIYIIIIIINPTILIQFKK